MPISCCMEVLLGEIGPIRYDPQSSKAAGLPLPSPPILIILVSIPFYSISSFLPPSFIIAFIVRFV